MKKIPITSEDREMLKSIYANGGSVDLYFLYEKYQLSPGQLSRLTRKFLAHKVVEEKDGILYLTATGKKWVKKNKKGIFFNILQYWKVCPEYWTAPKLDINQPYNPD